MSLRATANVSELIADTMEMELERDPRTLLLGEDVGYSGGTFGASRRLYRRFGEWRVRDTPISEMGFTGMAVGLAILTAYGSTTIDRIAADIYATPDAFRRVIPEALRDRPLKDPFVVDALEEWASREAAAIMVGLFVVAGAVTVLAVPPSLALGGRRDRRARMLLRDAPAAEGPDTDGLDPSESGLAL